MTALRQATDVLTGVDLTTLEGRGATAVDALASTTSRLDALRTRTLPVVEADGLWATGGARSFATWLSRRHHLAAHAAHTQVKQGRTLRDALPLTTRAALSGRIAIEHVGSRCRTVRW